MSLPARPPRPRQPTRAPDAPGATAVVGVRHEATAEAKDRGQPTQAAEAQTPFFLQASSCEVYGPSHHESNSEGHAVNPVSPYACAKLATELTLRAFRSSHGLRGLSVRLFNTYGPLEGDDALIPGWMSRALAGKPLQIEGTVGCGGLDGQWPDRENVSQKERVINGKVSEVHA